MFCGTAVLAAVLSGGCASSGQKSAPVSSFPGPAGVAKKDRVLWEYRNGLAAMRKGDFAQAKLLLDDAILTISNIYGKDVSAKKARGYFNEESKKNFLGEPYERVMAYWYRAVMYWMDGEPDNARACFRSAQFIDADNENKEYSSDYAGLEYLDGLASVKLNADGSDAFARAQKLSKIGALPPYNKNANVLVFMEFGNGPTKYATGEYDQELRIRPGASRAHGAWLRVANKAVRIGPYDDLNFQATTRGGRVMDHILANKAVFKSSTDTFGNVAIIGGAATLGASGARGNAGIVGAGLLAAGLIGKAIAASATPEADIRAWDNLPQYMSFAALELPPGTYNGSIDFTDAAGTIISTRTFTFTTPAPNGHDAVIFLSDKTS
jgi:tetratricopeptide (TPR) repeat protein